ncbi:MAG: hypothetical protein SGJ15_10440 [Bacteroidota bacterium]|nr:hypothetical protein [Bacteroidota bacterium]
MKKILIIAAVAGLSMASCKKDLTCTCISTSDAPGSVSQTEVTTYKGVKKKNVDEDCVSMSVKQTAGPSPISPYTTTFDCTLK